MTREEAIEIVKTQYPHDYVMKTALGMLIPELRESEDERIRKRLIKVVSDIAGSWPFEVYKITKKEAIAYLEKQEQEPIGTDFCTAVKNLMNLHKIKNKFTEEDYDFQAKELLKLIKQKPAEWSEEDEKKRKGLIKGLEDRMGFGWASDPFSREEYIEWLKSLRPQKKEDLPKWKPREEQMKALWEVYEGGEKQSALASLYADLKKLMED